jgi:hypothetical protein
MLSVVQRREDGLDSGQKFAPASVGTTARVVRDNSLTSSSASVGDSPRVDRFNGRTPRRYQMRDRL